MSKLTKLEKVDQQLPGLADDVRKWFAQGISCTRIAALIAERYPISLSRTPVARFRARRWVPEQERLREKRIELLAAQELAREQAIRDSMLAEVAGGVK